MRNFHSGRATLCHTDFHQIRDWQPDPNITLDNAGALTGPGRILTHSLAQRYQEAFPTILQRPYNRAQFTFRHTDRQRSESTARVFADGLFGPNANENVQFEDVPQVDTFLRVSTALNLRCIINVKPEISAKQFLPNLHVALQQRWDGSFYGRTGIPRDGFAGQLKARIHWLRSTWCSEAFNTLGRVSIRKKLWGWRSHVSMVCSVLDRQQRSSRVSRRSSLLLHVRVWSAKSQNCWKLELRTHAEPFELFEFWWGHQRSCSGVCDELVKPGSLFCLVGFVWRRATLNTPQHGSTNEPTMANELDGTKRR